MFTFPFTYIRIFGTIGIFEVPLSGLLRSGIFWWNNHSRPVCKNIQEDGLSDRVGGGHDQISDFFVWYFSFIDMYL